MVYDQPWQRRFQLWALSNFYVYLVLSQHRRSPDLSGSLPQCIIIIYYLSLLLFFCEKWILLLLCFFFLLLRFWYRNLFRSVCSASFPFFEQRGLVRATERPTILLIGWKSRWQSDGYVWPWSYRPNCISMCLTATVWTENTGIHCAFTVAPGCRKTVHSR